MRHTRTPAFGIRVTHQSASQLKLKQQHLPKDREKRAQNNWHLQPLVTALLPLLLYSLLYPSLSRLAMMATTTVKR